LKSGDDLTAAIDLLTRFFAEEGFDTPPKTIAANTGRLVEQSVCSLFLAAVDGKPAGVATVSLDFGIEFGWSAEMGDLYVLPECRGKGVARRLIDAVEDDLRRRGVAVYQVTVMAEAQAARDLISLYLRIGFVDEGRRLLYRTIPPR
jgi:GNAT superfamily N-acetyltransferase